MIVSYNEVEYFAAYYEVEFKGILENAHWFYWDHDESHIMLAHDADDNVIAFCKNLGDYVEVWVDGDRRMAEISLDKSGLGHEIVLVRIDCTPMDDARYNGSYDYHSEVDITA